MLKLRAFLVLVFASSTLFAQATQPQISVTGTAEIQVQPDQARLTVVLRSEATDLATAKRENDRRLAQVIALAKQFDISDRDTRISVVSGGPEYDTIKGKEVLSGYAFTRHVRIHLRSIARFEEFTMSLLKSGVTRVNDVSFESSEFQKFRREARQRAAAAAKEKAEFLAQQFNRKLGPAINISEEGDSFRPYSNVYSNVVAFRETTVSSGVGTIEVREQISVTFALE